MRESHDPRRKKSRFRNSLLSRYIIIICIALVLIPLLIPLSLSASWLVSRLVFPATPNEVTPALPYYGSGMTLEEMWHNEALSLNGKSAEEIDTRLKELKAKYPEAAMFWVDAEGTTHVRLPERSDIPSKWTPEDAVDYMKKAVSGEPFTVVAFIGGDEESTGQGFMSFELSREYMKHSTGGSGRDTRFYGFFMFLMFAFFILLSYLFFRDIRKRLLRLESAMTWTGPNGLPVKIPMGRPDEIGRLEQAFNHMIDELDYSRRREHEEEELRKNLIGNLSHDLRTPLTVLGGQLYSFRKEPLSEQGRQSLALMESKIEDLGGLIDHLLDYNLLTSGRYALTLAEHDVLRIVRMSAAAWYPLWEKAGIEADIELPEEEPLMWTIDEQGFRRVLDNLFQNLVRHAGTGGYVGIRLERRHGKAALVIADRGPGLAAGSPAKGAGLGLTIVDLLLREMGLVREAESPPTEGGTKIYIYPS
ncbi:HAMP domain-containing sensor histidine kinase [Paenibacillus sp. M1]|uniref:histidine kinase n=1 Tax=Paenibacillus haidiansis TaxID=1574488 RepID=A0ABU7VZG7_9BACL